MEAIKPPFFMAIILIFKKFFISLHYENRNYDKNTIRTKQ